MQRDEALLKNAQTDLERYQKLVAQDSIARQQLDTQQALVRQYEAALVIDQALVDAAKLNVTYTKIVAPLTGRIGLRMVDKGNYVTMGDATQHLRHHPDPADLGDLHHSRRMPCRRCASACRPARRSRCGRSTARRRVELGVGKLDTTDNLIDVTTGTVKLRAIFDNKDESLFPNQFVNVRLLVDTVKDATIVPVAAIQRGQPGIFVYLVKADDTVEIRVVELGVTDGEKVAVIKGLQVGDQVVIDGIDRLRDGAKIRKPAGAARHGGSAGRRAPPDGQPRRGSAGGSAPAAPGATGGGAGRPAADQPVVRPRHESVADLHRTAGRRPRC